MASISFIQNQCVVLLDFKFKLYIPGGKTHIRNFIQFSFVFIHRINCVGFIYTRTIRMISVCLEPMIHGGKAIMHYIIYKYLENNDCVTCVFMVLFRNQRLLFWSEEFVPSYRKKDEFRTKIVHMTLI